MNNMQQQLIALHNYESSNMALPLQDKNGLSWRVHLLPFLEEQELYSRFNLDEPWDSPNNIKLIPEMPPVYECPAVVLAEGLTIYQVPFTNVETNPAEKDRAVFDTSGQKISFRNISDGASNTAMLLEVDAAAAVEWTKPADWEFDPSNPMHDLGNVHPGTILVGFVDASTQTVSKDLDPETLKALITRQAGDVAGSW